MPITFTVLGFRADLQNVVKDYISTQSSKNALLDTANEVLDFANSGTKEVYEYVLQIFLKPGGLLLTIAFSLIAVYLISGIIDNYLMLGRDIDMHVMIKMLCALVVADVIIEATPTIINCVLGGSAALLRDVIALITEAEQDSSGSNPVTEFVDKAGLLQLVGAAIVTTVMKVVTSVPALGLKVILFSTQLEIIIRCIFAPIGLAGFANEAHRHEATRYLRKLIASGVYAAAIYITMFATLKISSTYTTASYEGITDLLGWITLNAGNVMTQLVGPFAAIGAIGTVKGIINEALGA